MLRLKNITKIYETGDTKVVALNNISLQFRDSEFVSILGPSGCGKTTLLNIIGGLDKYTEGDLFINGISTKEYKDSSWDTYRNQSIGFVFQNYNLISHQTVLSNVEMALTLSGISKKERRRRAKEALDKVGLKGLYRKKPNQMSGGQMQRVAIARAIVNNPEIILADEPTGALDTETSHQVMKILKEISKEKLVIMVTHNPSLAEQYSSRIIRFLDGNVTDDTRPLTEDELKELKKHFFEKSNREPDQKIKVKNKTSMSFFTALSLSFKNLLTKKARTILTAFAGSIGIIGIALILALSSGFQGYVDKLQADTLSAYPITISKATIDFDAIRKQLQEGNHREKFPSVQEIYVNSVSTQTELLTKQNDLTNEYIENVINKIDPKLYYSIDYTYNFPLNIYKKVNYMGRDLCLKMETSLGLQSSSDTFISTFASLYGDVWGQIIDSSELLEDQYDILDADTGGHLPTKSDELVLIVDRYNQISDVTLYQLGLIGAEEFQKAPEERTQKFTFEDIKKNGVYRLIDNDNLYAKIGDNHYQSKNMQMMDGVTMIDQNTFNTGKELKIVGIVRLKEDTTSGALNSTLGYHKDLIKELIETQRNSQIVKDQIANPTIDIFSGSAFEEYPNAQGTSVTIEEQYQNNLKSLGNVSTPDSVSIYPRSFNDKAEIKAYLDAFNEAQTDEVKKIYYSDIMDIFIGSINTMINSISYVLIAFTSISLIVSSIMIGIITYISVLERTKEIGILRSIGARKKDISRVFNAETFIIGLLAGVIGVGATLLLSFPINSLLYSLVEIESLAALNPLHGLGLIVISVILTIVSGLFPARVAAKRDPVIALRSE